MKKNVLGIIICSLFIFSACKDRTHSRFLNTSTVLKNTNAEQINITSSDEVPFIRYSDLFASTHFIQLEETENSLIGTVSKLLVTNNKSLAVFDNMKGVVILFDKHGHYICNVGRRGHGNDEYLAPEDVAYDPYRDEIIVWDNAKHSLFFYDTAGKLTHKTKLEWVIGSMELLAEDKIAVYMNNGENLTKQPTGHNLKIINRNGKVLWEDFEYDSSKSAFQPYCKQTLLKSSDRFYLHEPYSTDVYQIKEDSIVSSFVLNFGENTIPEQWKLGSNRDLNDKLKHYENLVYCSSLYSVNNHRLLTLVRNNVSMFCHGTKNGKYKFSAMMINDLDGALCGTAIKTVDNNNVYIAIEPNAADDIIEIIKKSKDDATLNEKLRQYYIKQTKMLERYSFLPFSVETYNDSLNQVKWTVDTSGLGNTLLSRKSSNPILQVCLLK